MMAEGHGLRGLQMREARHHRVGMLDGALTSATLERGSARSMPSMVSRT
jgi:hypothetical protein